MNDAISIPVSEFELHAVTLVGKRREETRRP